MGGRWKLRGFSGLQRSIDWLAAKGLVAQEPSQDGPDWFYVTDPGWEVAAGDTGIAQMAAAERLGVDLHALIAGEVRAQYLLGDYETAIFKAMRQVEIRVRELAGAGKRDLGVPLMRLAFKPGGPLSDPDQDAGEQEATMALFWGAIGVFKNPSSHREVEFEDPTLASEAVLLADLLLRMLDAIERDRS